MESWEPFSFRIGRKKFKGKVQMRMKGWKEKAKLVGEI